MTDKQKQLAKVHGTPEEFADATWQACDNLYITTTEAVDAIQKYKQEWLEAGNDVPLC